MSSPLEGRRAAGEATGAAQADENAPYLDWMWSTQRVSVCQNYPVKMCACSVGKIFLECV